MGKCIKGVIIFIYFTSDLHLGHANIIRHCNRPFTDVHEMDEALISNWNSRIHNNDTVYIIGDLMFRTELPPDEYLRRLKGKKHLIIGNHDKCWMNKADLNARFISAANYMEISDGKRKLVLCHYPMMSWNGVGKGSYLIYGHIHNNKNDTYWPLLRTMENALNAGIDINGYRPVLLDELVINNALFRKQQNAGCE